MGVFGLKQIQFCIFFTLGLYCITVFVNDLFNLNDLLGAEPMSFSSVSSVLYFEGTPALDK